MTAAASLVVLVAALVVVVLPGAAVNLALRPAAGAVGALALAPAVTLGLVWVAATVLHLVGAPVSSWTVLPWLAVVATAGLVVVRRRRGGLARVGPLVDRWDALGLTASTTAGLVLMWWGTSGLSDVPPNDDGTHHGLFVARILATHGIDVSRVVVSDVLTSTPTNVFYPLAMHVTASTIAVPGTSTGVALNATWLAIATVSLPFGMYRLARRTFPSARRAAVAVAMVSVLTPQLLVTPTFWGGIALIAGMSIVPAMADGVIGLVADPLADRREAALSGAALGLAAVGLVFTHTSEVATVALLVGCLGLAGVAERTVVPRWRRGLVAGSAFLVVVVVASAPWLTTLRGGAVERSITSADPLPVPRILTYLAIQLFGPAEILLVGAGVTVVGVVVALRRRNGWGWLAFLAVFSLLCVVDGAGWPGGQPLTQAWYSDVYRVALNLVYPGAAFAGLGTWWLARALRRRLAPAPVSSPRLAVGLPVVGGLLVVALPVCLALASNSQAQARGNFAGDPGSRTGGSLATPDAQASWAWLAARTGPGDRVLNEFVDGSGWMYADSGLAPVFPTRVLPPFPGDRGYLFDHAADLAHDTRAQAIARELHVRYAYVGDRIFPRHDVLGTPTLPVPAMLAGGWRVAFRTPSTVVLEVPAGT